MLIRFPQLPALLARFLDGARAVWPGLWALMGDHPAGPAWAAAYTVCYRGGRLLSLRFPLSAGAAELLFLLGLAVLVPDLTGRLPDTPGHLLSAAGLLLAGWGHAALATALTAAGPPASHLAGGLAGIAAVMLMPLGLGWPWLMLAAAAAALAARLVEPEAETLAQTAAATPAAATPAAAAGAAPPPPPWPGDAAPAASVRRVRPFVRLLPLLFNTYYFCFATYLPLEFARRGSPLLAGVGFAIGWAPSLAWHWLAPLALRWPPYRVVGGAALLLVPATLLLGGAGPWWWLAAALALQALLAGAVNLYARAALRHEEPDRLFGAGLGEVLGPVLAGVLWSLGGGSFLLNAQVASMLAAVVAFAAWAVAPNRWTAPARRG